MLLTTLLITFCCAAINHLGLIAAAERVIHHQLPVVNCPKCLTFWLTLFFGILEYRHHEPSFLAEVVAVALLAAWAAVWVELAMGGIDILYNKAYDALYPAADAAVGTAAAEAGSDPDDEGGSDTEMSRV